MCLIALAWRRAPGYRLIVAANRDEYHARPTASAAFWPPARAVFGGRDLQDGGSWMAVTRDARFAALTNFRDAQPPRVGARSRGHLVADYMQGSQAAGEYAAAVAAAGAQYNGFNLLTCDAASLWYAGSHGSPAEALAPGFHALSNARLNTPWPKALGLRAALRSAVDAASSEDELVERLLNALADTGVPADPELPGTGVGIERERLLAPRMIVAPVYGTRSGSVLLLHNDGAIRFVEQSFDADGRPRGRVNQLIAPSSRLPA